MFYFTDKGWQVFDKKISYRIRKEQTRQKLLMLLESGTLTPEEIKDIEDMIGGEP